MNLQSSHQPSTMQKFFWLTSDDTHQMQMNLNLIFKLLPGLYLRRKRRKMLSLVYTWLYVDHFGYQVPFFHLKLDRWSTFLGFVFYYPKYLESFWYSTPLTSLTPTNHTMKSFGEMIGFTSRSPHNITLSTPGSNSDTGNFDCTLHASHHFNNEVDSNSITFKIMFWIRFPCDLMGWCQVWSHKSQTWW